MTSNGEYGERAARVGGSQDAKAILQGAKIDPFNGDTYNRAVARTAPRACAVASLQMRWIASTSAGLTRW